MIDVVVEIVIMVVLDYGVVAIVVIVTMNVLTKCQGCTGNNDGCDSF